MTKKASRRLDLGARSFEVHKARVRAAFRTWGWLLYLAITVISYFPLPWRHAGGGRQQCLHRRDRVNAEVPRMPPAPRHSRSQDPHTLDVRGARNDPARAVAEVARERICGDLCRLSDPETEA